MPYLGLAYGRGRPTIRPAWRKCLFLYCYVIDREFGFLHVRLQTWFPFTIHVYVNGHERLARQINKRGFGYRRLDWPQKHQLRRRRFGGACAVFRPAGPLWRRKRL